MNSHEQKNIVQYLSTFEWNGNASTILYKNNIKYIVNEFWTAKQRQGNKIHEISYRACFKSQLPEFFINYLTNKGDIIYDPFMGRGTSLIQAQLMQRKPMGNDINPISIMLAKPRLNPPTINEVQKRLEIIDYANPTTINTDLLAFYHPQTLNELTNLRQYFLQKNMTLDNIDEWIRMVALNRLTGHSKGFFSGFTMPPNQAISVESQKKINAKLAIEPPYRNIKEIIMRKTKILLSELPENYNQYDGICYNCPAHHTPNIDNNFVNMIITSPPFLDIVDYAQDNWLRAWFAGVDIGAVPITILKKIEQWIDYMRLCFIEFERILKPNGYIIFEVGELQNGKILLEEAVINAMNGLGLTIETIMINQQNFTKTANIWGVNNNDKGTNTNRLVIIRK